MWIQLHSQILGLQQNLFKSVVLIKFIKIQLIDKFMLSGRQIDIINDKIWPICGAMPSLSVEPPNASNTSDTK